ncbi:MAG TPA: hypothetical protein VGB30_00075 [bacterium]|jgi:hypothetical protein
MIPVDDEDEKLVEFPSDSVAFPTPGLPGNLGRIDEGHPLKRPLMIAIIIFAIIFLTAVIYSIISPQQDTSGQAKTEYREQGGIVWQDESLRGWFLDPNHQNFESDDGGKFTYVDPHNRENGNVAGHWRKIE